MKLTFLKKIVPLFVLKQIKYLTSKVYCPICKSRFKIFATFGIIPRENAKCWNCHSLERHRLQYLYLNNKTDIFTSKRKLKILHFAPEKMFYNMFSDMKNIDYFPCDIQPENYLMGPVEVLKADITEIPFENNYFDYILCNHVLEHIPNDKVAMSELYRVLKPKGIGIFQVPIDYSKEQTYEDTSIISPEDRLIAFGQEDHVRWYGRDYKDRLRSIGFKVNEDNYVNTFSPKKIYQLGLMASEKIYDCRK